MATSPIYSWPEPDNTDLVKNGALAIRTMGNAIDTTMGTMVAKTVIDAKGDLIAGTAADTVNRLAVGNNGETLVADSSTATGLKWAAPATGMSNPMTTTGDTIYSSSGSTPARLGIGSTGQVLTVSGGVPTWATSSSGGMTLISTTSLSGASTTISSLPQTYNYLQFVIENSGTTTSDPILFKPNNADFATNYQFAASVAAPTYVSSLTGTGAGSQYRLIVINLWNYTSTASTKGMTYSTFGNTMSNGYASFQSLSAITSVVFAAYSGNFNGGTVKMYGVK